MVRPKCKNCDRDLYGRWKNFCSLRCGGIYYVKNNHKETDIEKKLREWLETQKIEFKSQVSIKNITIPDFMIGNICLYADGDYWHRTARRQYLDRKTNSRLIALGYKVLRYKGSDILKNFDKVAKDILVNLNDSVRDIENHNQISCSGNPGPC